MISFVKWDACLNTLIKCSTDLSALRPKLCFHVCQLCYSCRHPIKAKCITHYLIEFSIYSICLAATSVYHLELCKSYQGKHCTSSIDVVSHMQWFKELLSFILYIELTYSQIHVWSSSISLNNAFVQQCLHHKTQDSGQHCEKIWMGANSICYYFINCYIWKRGKCVILQKGILQLAVIKNYPLCLIKKIN